jgi:glycosyltransferase involved in cell wall biosynthesis
MPELIVEGATGFLVDDLDGAVHAVDRTRELDRAAIRGHALARFGRERMVDAYIDAYEAVTSARR